MNTQEFTEHLNFVAADFERDGYTLTPKDLREAATRLEYSQQRLKIQEARNKGLVKELEHTNERIIALLELLEIHNVLQYSEQVAELGEQVVFNREKIAKAKGE